MKGARLWVGRLHLWLGLILGVHLALLGVTGAFLVFKDEIEFATLAGKIRSAGPSRLTAEGIVQAVRRESGEEPTRLEYRKEPYSRVGVRIKGGERWVDPATGNVARAEHAGIEFALSLHQDLLFEERGRLVSAWFGLGGLLVLFGGLYLWWPKTVGQLKNRFKVKRGAGWKRRAMDLHNLGGALSFGPLLLIVMTGSALAFGEPVREALLRWGGEPEAKAARVDPRPQRVSLDEMIRTTETAAPGATEFVFLPSKPGDTLRVLKTLPSGENWRTRVRVAIDPHDGRVVRIDRPRASLPGRLNDSLEAIHYGLIGGLATKGLSVVVGLLPLGLLVTGASIHLYKRKAQRNKVQRNGLQGDKLGRHEDFRGYRRRGRGAASRRLGDLGRSDDEPDPDRQER